MGIINALFEVTDERLQALYHRAWLDCNRGFVNSRKYPELDKAIFIYAREHNCSYDEALILQRPGRRWGGWRTADGLYSFLRFLRYQKEY